MSVTENWNGTYRHGKKNGTQLLHAYVPLRPDYVALKTVRKIEYQLGYCNQIEKAVDTALHQAKAIRQGILKKAFEGRL